MLRDQLDPAAIRRAETACLESGRADRTPCWICGKMINYRTAATVHYIGDPREAHAVPVHKRCAPVRNSRQW